MGLFGGGSDLIIPWRNIVKIGSDVVLVKMEELRRTPDDQESVEYLDRRTGDPSKQTDPVNVSPAWVSVTLVIEVGCAWNRLLDKISRHRVCLCSKMEWGSGSAALTAGFTGRHGGKPSPYDSLNLVGDEPGDIVENRKRTAALGFLWKTGLAVNRSMMFRLAWFMIRTGAEGVWTEPRLSKYGWTCNRCSRRFIDVLLRGLRAALFWDPVTGCRFGTRWLEGDRGKHR